MSQQRTEKIETVFGYCRLHLADRLAKTTLALRVYQNVSGGVPTLRRAEGKFADLPKRDAVAAVTSKKALTLELEDGRKGSVFITDLQGSFILSGPLV
jgi:hypothetical protein